MEPEDKEGELFLKIIELLLRHQYVISEWLPGEIFRAITGTGMGLHQSGIIAGQFPRLDIWPILICCKLTGHHRKLKKIRKN